MTGKYELNLGKLLGVVGGLLASSLLSVQALAAKPLVHDAEYYVLAAQKDADWAKQDEVLDAKLEALRKELGIEEHVEFVGFLSKEDLQKEYTRCDIWVNPGIIDTEMLQSCFGGEASMYPNPADWAEETVPWLASLSARDNGRALTAPGG